MAEKQNTPEIRFEGFTDPWEQRKLGELCTFSKGHGYSKADIRDAGTPLILYGRLYTQYESRIEEVDTFTVEQDGSILSRGNEVIVPASGETAEDIAVASSVRRSGIILGGDLNVVTPTGKLDPDYTALAITYSKAHDDLAKRAQGKSVVHVHGNDIAEVEISYPSESEQKRISSVVLNLDSLITLHQRKYDKLCTVKKSMLDKMFPKPGETEPEIRFEGFTDPWEQRKFLDVVDVCSGKDYKHLKEGSIPVYGTGGFMTSVDEALSYDRDAVGIGRKGTIDKPYLLKAPFWTVDTLFYAIPKSDIDLEFVHCSFLNVDWKSKDESTGLPSLSKEAINETLALVPSFNEQSQLGEFFNNLDSLITLHQREPRFADTG